MIYFYLSRMKAYTPLIVVSSLLSLASIANAQEGEPTYTPGTNVVEAKAEMDQQIAESAGILADMVSLEDENNMFGTGGLGVGPSSFVGGVIGSQYGNQYGNQYGSGGLGVVGTEDDNNMFGTGGIGVGASSFVGGVIGSQYGNQYGCGGLGVVGADDERIGLDDGRARSGSNVEEAKAKMDQQISESAGILADFNTKEDENNMFGTGGIGVGAMLSSPSFGIIESYREEEDLPFTEAELQRYQSILDGVMNGTLPARDLIKLRKLFEGLEDLVDDNSR